MCAEVYDSVYGFVCVMLLEQKKEKLLEKKGATAGSAGLRL